MVSNVDRKVKMLCFSLFCFQFVSGSYQCIYCKVRTELQLFAFTFTFMYPFHTTRHIRLIHTSQPDLSKAVELIAVVGSSPQLFHLSLSLLYVCHHSLFPLSLPALVSWTVVILCPQMASCSALLPTWASVGKVLDSRVVLRGFFIT